MHSSIRYLRFNIYLLCIALTFLLFFFSILFTLNTKNSLPPPPITATACIDEKFMFLHENDIQEASLITTGSSATWRNLDFSAFKDVLPELTPVNTAPCYLNARQSAFYAEFLLENLRQTKTLVFVTHIRDFTTCPPGETTFFSKRLAKSYIFDKRKMSHLYLTNFRLLPFLGTIDDLALRRRPPDPEIENAGELFMDPFGSGPLVRTLDYYPPPTTDDTCFKALTQLEDLAQKHNIKLIVAFVPEMPYYIANYDPERRAHLNFYARVAATLKSPDTFLIRTDHLNYPDDAFTDAVHLKRQATYAFSHYLAQEIDQHFAAIRATSEQ